MALGLPAAAQRTQPAPRDTTSRDTTAAKLLAVEVHASILPVAGPTIGSGVPARISTLTGREIDAWEPRTLAEALGSQPGVSVYDDLGAPYKLNVSTRGFNVGPTVGLPSGVTVFLDGVRQNEPDAQEVNFDLLPMEHVTRVELLSGSASLLGPNSLAGAVNLITRRGSGPPAGELEVSFGSFGHYSAEASLGGLSRAGWDYYASGGYERESGWRAATGAETYNAFLNLGRSGRARAISVQAFGARSRVESAGSLPERIFAPSPRTNFTAGDFEDLDAQQVALSGYAPVADGRGSFTAHVRRSAAERFNVNQPPDENVRSFTNNYTFGTSADWRWNTTLGTSALGAGTFALRTGIDGAAQHARVRIFAEPQGGDEGRLTTDVTSPGWDLAGYAVADLRFGRVTLSGGARYDYIRIPFRNRLDPEDRTTNVFRRLNPRGGISVDLGGSSVYASAGQSFRAPAILELGCADPEATCPLPFALGEDPPLEPVKATTYEVGGRWVRGPILVSGSVYRSAVRDEIFFVASETALLSGYFTNVARTRREGAEIAAELSIGERTFAYANYAFTRATFRCEAEIFSIRSEPEFAASTLGGPNDVGMGDRIPLVPDHQLKAGTLVSLPRGLAFGFDARYVGRQWLRGDEANETERLAPYLLANARIGFTHRAWEIAAVASNVFDTHRAVFGAFNENRQAGELERFLTPMNARAIKLIVRREVGGDEGDR